jgi:hypothetical protein
MSLTRTVHLRPICPLVLHLLRKVKGEPSQFLTTDRAEGRICGKSRARVRRGACNGRRMADCWDRGCPMMIGHNGGPSVAEGLSWRVHCWTKAREALLPTLPIEVLRTRVRRAADLGLEYKTYASVRAQTGHDVVAFLFSSNALRVAPQRLRMPEGFAVKLDGVKADRIGLTLGRLLPQAVLAQNPELDRTDPAPALMARWAEAGQHLREVLGRVPGDRVLLVGDQALEREWCAAGRLAGYLPAERYFGV